VFTWWSDFLATKYDKPVRIKSYKHFPRNNKYHHGWRCFVMLVAWGCFNSIGYYKETEHFYFGTMDQYDCYTELSPQSTDLLLATERNQKICISNILSSCSSCKLKAKVFASEIDTILFNIHGLLEFY